MIHIPASEWVIMKELWKDSPLTSRQIIDNIGDSFDWNAKTVHTMISRLCKKGAIIAKKQSGTTFYDYYPAITEEECIREETRSFVNRIFSGSLKNFVSAFVQSGNVSKEEIAELRRMLEKYEKDE